MGNAVSMMVFMGILYVVAVEWFLTPLLTVFGATQEIMPYAESYTRITAAGMPLLISQWTRRVEGRWKSEIFHNLHGSGSCY